MKTLALLLIFPLFVSMQLSAQDLSGSIVSFGGGPSFPSKSGSSTGINVFFNYGRIITGNFGLRGDLQYHNFSFSSETDPSVPIHTKTEGSDFGITLGFEALGGNFNSPSKLLFYGVFGLGIDLGGGSGTIKSSNTNTSSSFSSGPDFNIAMGIGGAAGYRISSKGVLTFELKYEVISNNGYLPVRVGLTFLPSIGE